MKRTPHRIGRRRGCSFSGLIGARRDRGSPVNRVYMIAGILLARWVQRRRSRFTVDDVKLGRRLVLPGIRRDPAEAAMASQRAIRAWCIEFLSCWYEGAAVSHSRGADEILGKCPQLTGKVRKHWVGY